MACPSSMASERKPPELTPSTTFDNISLDAHLEDYAVRQFQSIRIARGRVGHTAQGGYPTHETDRSEEDLGVQEKA